MQESIFFIVDKFKLCFCASQVNSLLCDLLVDGKTFHRGIKVSGRHALHSLYKSLPAKLIDRCTHTHAHQHYMYNHHHITACT